RLEQEVPFIDGATTRAKYDLQRQLVVGEFAATVETVGNTSNPVEMTVSVGWSDSAARQKYDFDENFRTPESVRLHSTPNGQWLDVSSDQIVSDEDVVRWLLLTLGEWIKSNGRY